MKVIIDSCTLENFDTWSGATDTKKAIINAGKESEFENLIEELYPDGITDTQLNDILWFEPEYIFETLGISEEEDDDDDEEDE